MQCVTVVALAGTSESNHESALPATEAATALLNLLAIVLASAPECRTPRDMRQLSEQTGRQLLVLLRGYRKAAMAGGGPLTVETK